MQWAARAGVPVPTVHAVDGPDIVMDRVEGPTMMSALADRPDQGVRFGALLADLHRRLDATTTATTAGEPDTALVHGDLHPGNVLLSANGPVLIDWTNHRVGPRSLDVALTWIVLACFQPHDDVRTDLDSTRALLLSGFLGSIDRAGAVDSLTTAAAIRHGDPATTPTEHARIDRLVAEHPADR